MPGHPAGRLLWLARRSIDGARTRRRTRIAPHFIPSKDFLGYGLLHLRKVTPELHDGIRLQLRVFGGFQVLVRGAPLPALRSKREQWLLALLVLRSNRDTSRRWLAATLWPDNDEEQGLF